MKLLKENNMWWGCKREVDIKGVTYFIYTHRGNCDNPIHMYNY